MIWLSPETKGYSRRKTEDLSAERADQANQKANIDDQHSYEQHSISEVVGSPNLYSPRTNDRKRLATVIQTEIRDGAGKYATNRAKTSRYDLLAENLENADGACRSWVSVHPEEAKLLADEAYQRKVAAAIYRGILRYASGESGRACVIGELLIRLKANCELVIGNCTNGGRNVHGHQRISFRGSFKSVWNPRLNSSLTDLD